MAPKVNCNAIKLASIVTYLQESRVCHSIKDLEKHLPSVASINGMQVKDYLQNLSDDSRITVEKIGSGNWYWSFASQAKKEKQRALDEAKGNYERAENVVKELRHKLADSAAAMAEEEDSEESREELNARKAVLEADLKALRKELEAYSDNDPTELERKREETTKLMKEVDECTEDLESMETWFSRNQGKEQLVPLRMALYGDEFDTEEYEFKKVVLEL